MSRTRCCIEGCNRTTAKPFAEWICQPHWSLIPKKRRAAYGRVKRRCKKFGEWLPTAERLWQRLKREAAGE